MLSATLSEQIGQAWTLSASFLVDKCYTPPPRLRVHVANDQSDIKRSGFVHRWSLQDYDLQHAILTIQAFPFSTIWHQPMCRVFACEGNLETLAQSLDAATTIRWNPSPPRQAKDQWIALDESPWAFFLRVARQAGYHWHQPFSENGSVWEMRGPRATFAEPLSCKVGDQHPLAHEQGRVSLTSHDRAWVPGEHLLLAAAPNKFRVPLDKAYRVVFAKSHIDRTGSILGHGESVPLRTELQLQNADSVDVWTALPTVERSLYAGFVANPRNGNPRNPVQEDGRYPVRFDFESETAAWGRIGRILGLSGSSAACHLPLQTGTRIWLGFLPNDPDTPWILGAESVARNAPVTRDNSDEFVIRTRFGATANAIDQADGKCAWEIATPGGHLVRLDDGAQQLRMELATGERGQHILCDSAGMHIKIGEQFELDFDQTNGEIRCGIPNGTLLVIGAQGSMRCTVPDQALVQLDRDEGILLQAKKRIRIAAPKLELIGEQQVELQCGENYLRLQPKCTQLHSPGDIVIQGQDQCQLQGGTAQINGDTVQVESRQILQAQANNITWQARQTIDAQAALIRLN